MIFITKKKFIIPFCNVDFSFIFHCNAYTQNAYPYHCCVTNLSHVLTIIWNFFQMFEISKSSRVNKHFLVYYNLSIYLEVNQNSESVSPISESITVETLLEFVETRSFPFLVYILNVQSCTLRDKCPNTELFLVHIFLYSDWIRRFTE